MLAGLMALSCVLAYFFFFNQSMRLDESQSLWQTGRSAGEILSIVAQDVHVPLYHEVLHFWRVFVGDSVEAGRLLSLIFFVASIPALFMLGRLAYNQSVGLFAAALFAISPFMNWYASEIRMYTLFTFLVILNQYFFLSIMRSRSAETTSAGRAWLGYTLTALFGVFTHYFFFLTLAAQAVFFLLQRDLFPKGSFKCFAGTLLLLTVSFAPWVAWVWVQGQASQASPALAAPNSVDVFSTFSQFIFGFQNDHINTFVLSLWPLTVLLGILALRKTRALAPETQYFIITLVLSMALAFVVSVLLKPVFVSRYLIFTVPSLYLLLTSFIAAYPPRAALFARYTVVGLMLVGLTVEIVSASAPVKENYREAAHYLTENAKPQDIVILSAPFSVYPVEYYYRGSAPMATIPNWDRYAFGAIPAFSSENLPQEVEDTTRNYQYAWLLLSYDQGYEEEVRIYFDTHFERVQNLEFSPGITLWVYKIRYDTPLAEEEFVPGTTTPQTQ
jgi:mannosyltransferase